MTRAFRPMKGEAIDLADVHKLTFPLLISPKMDGIRGVVAEQGVISNRIKLLPNRALQAMYGTPEFQGLDGEFIVGPVTAPNVFNRSTSYVMSQSKPYPEDGLHFYVFDDCTRPEESYFNRLSRLKGRVAELSQQFPDINLHITQQIPVYSAAEALNYEEQFVSLGYEGVMLRAGEAPYKYGRATLRQQWLLKLKRFMDKEAVVVGFEELFHNHNEAEIDDRGLTKRSSHAENQEAGDTLGSLVCRCNDFEDTFKIGTGFTADERAHIWRNREQFLNQTLTFTYQEVGVKDKPRFPKFKGWRKD